MAEGKKHLGPKQVQVYWLTFDAQNGNCSQKLVRREFRRQMEETTLSCYVIQEQTCAVLIVGTCRHSLGGV
jgi:hypothetical protein